MAKFNKQTKTKRKQVKKNTQKSGCNCKSPLFFIGGGANNTKRKRKGKRKCKAPILFVGGNTNSPYPINPLVNALGNGISTRTIPQINGGKSNRNKKGITRKRVIKMKGGSSILATGDHESNSVVPSMSIGSGPAIFSGDFVRNTNIYRVPDPISTVNV